MSSESLSESWSSSATCGQVGGSVCDNNHSGKLHHERSEVDGPPTAGSDTVTDCCDIQGSVLARDGDGDG